MLHFEFQVVILAGGRGFRISQLLQGKPKCLLPIANKPMIQYPLELLVRHRIQEAIIIVLDNEEEQIKSAIAQLEVNIHLEFVTIPHSNDYATAESLRHIKHRLKKDVLLLSCDLITDLNLNQLIDLYRLKNATCLCLFSSLKSEKQDVIPANKLDNNQELDYVGLDGNDHNRLVFFEPDVFNESIPMKKVLLKCCPNLIMNAKLMDSHIYIFRNWILDYLDYKIGIRSVKLDLVPSLVRKQFRKLKKNDNLKLKNQKSTVIYEMEAMPKNKGIADFIQISKTEKYMAEIDLQDPFTSTYPESTISCGALIIESGYCIRSNTMLGYCEANRKLLKQKSVEFLTGRNSTISPKSVIKRTVIGSNCQIGENVKLNNCILQDNITIDTDCHITNSLICSGVTIGSKVIMENCLVSPKQKLNSGKRCKNEIITEEMLDS